MWTKENFTVSMPRISHSSKEENNKGNTKLSRIGLSGIREGSLILSQSKLINSHHSNLSRLLHPLDPSYRGHSPPMAWISPQFSRYSPRLYLPTLVPRFQNARLVKFGLLACEYFRDEHSPISASCIKETEKFPKNQQKMCPPQLHMHCPQCMKENRNI